MGGLARQPLTPRPLRDSRRALRTRPGSRRVITACCAGIDRATGRAGSIAPGAAHRAGHIPGAGAARNGPPHPRDLNGMRISTSGVRSRGRATLLLERRDPQLMGCPTGSMLRFEHDRHGCASDRLGHAVSVRARHKDARAAQRGERQVGRTIADAIRRGPDEDPLWDGMSPPRGSRDTNRCTRPLPRQCPRHPRTRGVAGHM